MNFKQFYLTETEKYPTPDSESKSYYLKRLKQTWYHGSYDKFDKFSGPTFFSSEGIAASYGYDGYLYKCKLHVASPFIMVENNQRLKTYGAKGMKVAGTDEELRDFIRDELLKGLSDSQIKKFDDAYSDRGPGVPSSMLNKLGGSYDSIWEVIYKNLKRLGFDSIMFMDERFDKQARDIACIVLNPKDIDIVGVTEIDERGKFNLDFIEVE
jgi:hypothetical protein